MAKSREEMQDIALYHMDKMNRRTQGERENKPQTLEEQMKELDRKNSLTPEQRLAELPWGDWNRSLMDWLQSRETHRKYGAFTSKFFTWLSRAKRAELEEHHRKGTKFSDMVPWMKDMQMIHMNL